jgi:hypothetical protein
MKTKRRPISKRVRFEVFKRDSFKCQYCGAASPDALLHVDHLHPIAEGGESDITNLITACVACNLGKSDKLLSDTSAASKRKAQMDQLQERRDQLEMMSEWQRGLLDLKEQEVAACHEIWRGTAKTFCLNERGLESLRKLIKQFGLREVMEAIPIASKYFETGSDGDYTPDSVNLGLAKLGGICVVTRRSKEDPELHEIYRLRSALMRRIPSLRPWHVTNRLNSLRAVGYTADEIRLRMTGVDRYWTFEDMVDSMIKEVA